MSEQLWAEPDGSAPLLPDTLAFQDRTFSWLPPASPGPASPSNIYTLVGPRAQSLDFYSFLFMLIPLANLSNPRYFSATYVEPSSLPGSSIWRFVSQDKLDYSADQQATPVAQW